MSSGALPQQHPRWLLAGILGVWAAVVALTPGAGAKAVLIAPAFAAPLVWWTVAQPGRWIALFFAVALLAPPLPIPIGDSGPHPSLAIAAIGILAGAAWLPRWRGPLTGVSAAMLALFGVLLASVSMAAVRSGPAIAAGSLARVALFAIPVYVFLYTAHGPGSESASQRDWRRLFWIAAAAALFACIDFYFQLPAPAGYGPQFVWLDSGVYRRAQGLFYEASTLGNFCAFFLVMIAVAFTRSREEVPLSRWELVLGAAPFFGALVLSYSRASVLNVIVAIAALAWWNRRRLPVTRLVIALALGGAAGAIALWKIFPGFAELYWRRLSGSAEFFFSATEGVLSGRVASWRLLADWIAANPWQALLGIGYKTLPYSDYLGGPVVADNMYMSLLVETGILGLAALVWLNVSILRAAAGSARSADRTRAVCGTWIFCFWLGQTVQMLSGDLLTYWRVLPVYFWVLALAVRR